MKQKLLSILFLVLFILFPPKQTFAATNFTTDYAVIYTVEESGISHAKLNVTLTNSTTQYYASSYKIQVGFDEITNVQASDPEGKITPIVTKNADGYVIEVRFNKKSVGMGKKLPFTITFDTKNLANNYGNIWEINIPGIANPQDFNSFSVTLQVPPSFGKPAYTKPEQSNSSLTFTKDQLGKSGISIGFGEKQHYRFDLSYHIKNNKPYPITTEIALPPDTNYQTISLTDISPKPITITKDSDGNWLAKYKLFPSQKMEITVAGLAEVRLHPEKQPLSPEEYALYTKQQEYWQTEDPAIAELAKELGTPEAIYDYVVKTLSYDFTRVTDDKPRLGAVGSLNKQNSAVCREFTDLFIALARKANIPARELNGFAYTENAKQRPISKERDILHAWPEYYDKEKQTWIMVDPTWGNTTGGTDYFSVLDFDHVVFAIKGKEDDYPIPAGGYKFDEINGGKDVSVTFAKDAKIQPAEIQIDAQFPKTVIAGLPITGKILVSNTGGSSLTPTTISIKSVALKPQDQVITTKKMLPFAKESWKVSFVPTNMFSREKAVITITVNNHVYTKEIVVKPLYETPVGIGIAIGSVVVVGALILIGKKKRK